MKIRRIVEYRKLWREFYSQKDKYWAALFFAAIFCLFVWNAIFLDAAAFGKWLRSTANTYSVGVTATAFAFLFAKGFLFARLWSERNENRKAAAALQVFLDFLQSLPQVVFILFAYAIMIFYLPSVFTLRIVWLAFALGVIFSKDVYDEMISRINYFKKTEFYNASLVAGIPEKRIVNRDILWLNSAPYLLNRAVVVFTSAVFLLCSADFIISVGLSPEISLTSLPATLGNLLANISAKEDLLAVRELFTNPFYLSALLTKHLQGFAAAFTLVFTIIAGYKISNGIVERKKLNG